MKQKLHLLIVSTLFLTFNANSQTALQFNGSSNYVTFGNSSTLGLTQFTLECWFKKTGAGTTAFTGWGGRNAIPLISRGRAQDSAGNPDFDGWVKDMNYFVGIDPGNGRVIADFEENNGNGQAGANFGIETNASVVDNMWNHVAVTYNGSVFRIYLNGVLEASQTFSNRTPQSLSVHHATIGSAQTSNGTANGFFNGIIDHVRIWNRAKSQQSVTDSMFLELSSAPGLVGNWLLEEGSGSTTANTESAGSAINGTLINSPSWVAGFDANQMNSALLFNGTSAHVNLGGGTSLSTPSFTVECWFNKSGSGLNSSFGALNLVLPLVTKGRNETDNDNTDCNYFLGILDDGRIAGLFEEGSTSTNPGMDHSILGTSTIQNNRWYHAALTYDGVWLKVYLNGVLENSDSVGRTPQFNNIQPVGIGTCLFADGSPEGFFQGRIDQVRIWNFARTEQTINDSMGVKITPTSGLIGNWKADEGYGHIVYNLGSAGSNGDGDLMWGALWDKGILFENDVDTFTNTANDSNWFNPVNWNHNLVPYSFRNVHIKSGNKVVLSGTAAAQCRNIDVAGTLVIKGGSLSVWGNISNNGTVRHTLGTLYLKGNLSTTISGNAMTLRNLVMDKISTGNVTISANVSISNSLTLTRGIIHTSTCSNLNILDNATTTSGSDVSYVDGLMSKTGNEAFSFPVGDDNWWARIGISAPSNTSDRFCASRVATPFVDIYGKQSPLTFVSGLEYWTLERTSGSSAVSVTLFWNDNNRSQFYDVSDTALVVAHYDGTQWVNETQASRTGNLFAGSITSQSQNSFSPFTFGSLTMLNSLPVTLLSLEGKVADKQIQVLWSTASEINNDYFTVEKSLNGNSWLPIGEVKAAGHSNSILHYMHPDFNPQSGTQFYRLKITSLTGEVSYSHNVAVKFNDHGNNETVYPNPANEVITLTVNASNEEPAQISIFNSLGLKVFEMSNVTNSMESIDISGFQNGLYIIEIAIGNQISRSKVYKF